MLGGVYRCERKEKSLVGLLPLHLTHAGHTVNPTVYVQILSRHSLLCSGRLLWSWQVTVELLSSWSVRYSEIHKDWLDQPHLGVISLQIAEAPSEVLCDNFLPHPDLEGTPRMKSGQLCTGPGSIQCRRAVIPQRAGGGDLRWASGVPFLSHLVFIFGLPCWGGPPFPLLSYCMGIKKLSFSLTFRLCWEHPELCTNLRAQVTAKTLLIQFFVPNESIGIKV